MQALELLTSIPHLDREAILRILSHYPLEKIYSIRQLLDERLNNDMKTVYIVTNDKYGGFSCSNIFMDFIEQHRDLSSKSGIHREDPIIVLMLCFLDSK